MVQSWIIESRVCNGLQFLIFLLRIYARTRKVGGVRGWQGDDYMVLVAMLAMFCNIAFSEAIAVGTGITVDDTTPEYLVDKVRLSMKFGFMVWVGYFSYIWSLKSCMLFFFSRLTYGLGLHKMVILTAYIIGLSFVAGILELFLHCRPLHLAWQVRPYPGVHCATGQDNFLAIGSMNFFTDLLMLCIPIPLLLTVRMPMRRKLGCAFLLCSGAFVMVATALRNIFGYLAIHGRAGTINKGFVIGWATRETFVLTIVVNAPCIKPLITSELAVLKTWTSGIRSKVASTAADSGAASARRPSRSAIDPNGDESNASAFFFRVNKKRPAPKSLSAYDRSIMATANNDNIDVDLEKGPIEKDSIESLASQERRSIIVATVSVAGSMSPPHSPSPLSRTLSASPAYTNSTVSVERTRVVDSVIIEEEGEEVELGTAERVSIRSVTRSIDDVVQVGGARRLV